MRVCLVVGGAAPPARLLLPVIHATCFDVLMIDEGGELDLSENDPGNWTGGEVGKGSLDGSRWGISSAVYPDVNKQTLTRLQAEGIYLHDYWAPSLCDELPAAVRFLVYTSSVNSGREMGALWLQRAVLEQGIEFEGGADGALGPKTVAAANQADTAALVREFAAQRLFSLSADTIFGEDRLGLSRRLVNDAATAALPFS